MKVSEYTKKKENLFTHDQITMQTNFGIFHFL